MLTRGGIAANLEKHRGEGSCEYKFQCKSLLTSPSMDISQDFLHQHKHRFIYSGGDGFAALSGSCQGASLYFFFFWWVTLSLWPSLSPPQLELQLLVGGMPSVWRGWILRNAQLPDKPAGKLPAQTLQCHLCLRSRLSTNKSLSRAAWIGYRNISVGRDLSSELSWKNI